jgi:hypothetical protein
MSVKGKLSDLEGQTYENGVKEIVIWWRYEGQTDTSKSQLTIS